MATLICFFPKVLIVRDKMEDVPSARVFQDHQITNKRDCNGLRQYTNIWMKNLTTGQVDCASSMWLKVSSPILSENSKFQN